MIRILKEYKVDIILAIAIFGVLSGISLMAMEIVTEIENQGGMREIIVDIGRGIKSIIDDIKR